MPAVKGLKKIIMGEAFDMLLYFLINSHCCSLWEPGKPGPFACLFYLCLFGLEDCLEVS